MKERSQRYHRVALNRLREFSFFGPKTFPSISRFLEVAQVKERFQRYERVALNSCEHFSF